MQYIILKKINHFLQLSRRRKWLLIITFGFAIYTHLLMRFFKKYALFGKQTDCIQNDFFDENLSADIAFAIGIVNKYFPWENVCRHQAYQAKLLCQLYGIPYLIYVGVKKKESGSIEGHAWTIIGKKIITGQCQIEEYTVLSVYTNTK